MIVVHVGEYVSGGVATYLRTLIKEQIRNSQIEKIIVFKSKRYSEQLHFDSPKVKVINYEYTRDVRGIVTILGLWKRIINLHPDVIHLHSTFAGFLRIHNIINRQRFKVIYCSHGWAFARDSNPLVNKAIAGVERILAIGCDKIINISESEASKAITYGLPISKMVTIENGIEIPKVLPNKHRLHGELKLLFVGRFDRQKGVDLLIAAARQIPDVSIYLVGSAVLHDSSFIQNNFPNNVHVLGWLSPDRVGEKMRQVDAVLVPSRWEGFGLVAIEAMKNQTAVLAANVGGLSNIVKDGENGFLFEPLSVAAIVSTVGKVNRPLLREMGIKGQHFVANHYNAVGMQAAIYREYVNN